MNYIEQTARHESLDIGEYPEVQHEEGVRD